MDSRFEDKLVALLEAAGAPLPRAQIFSRVDDDDIENEESLAKCLGRLVASGRLIRSKRPRFNTRPEFVYSTPGSRMGAIAAAAEKVPQPVQPAPPAQEPAMAKSKDKFEHLIDHLVKADVWLAPGAIAIALDENRHRVGERLATLAKEKKIQTRGTRRGLRYAALGVAETAEKTAPAEPKNREEKGATARPTHRPEKAPRRNRARGKADKKPPGTNLAEFGAPKRPTPEMAPAEVAEEVRCAIEDSGLFALNDGKATIRLKPAQIHQVVKFLEVTQLVWMNAA